ncbi:MAG: gliding motility-associated C-terminal domain-containing protein [Bacteroidales bacterium]
MKKQLSILIFGILLMHGIKAQVIDTLCYNDPFGRYTAQGSPGSSFNWKVTGGLIFNTNGTDSIEVHWDSNAAKHYIQLQEISKYGCRGDTIYGEVIVSQADHAQINGPDSVCRNEIISLQASKAESYKWSSGDTSANVQLRISSDTTISLIADDGCQPDTAFKNITALPLPAADFSVTPPYVLTGEQATFTSNSSGDSLHYWHIANDHMSGDLPIINYRFFDKGYFRVMLVIENEFGCVDTAKKYLEVNDMLVNTITPDGDGINDTWELDHLAQFPDCQVWIFDRWSNQIFYSKGYHEPWDGTHNGTPVPDGSYYFVIDYGDGSEPVKSVLTVIR